MSVPEFAVVPGVQVQRILDGREKTVLELVEAAYRAHGAGRTVNPPSYFLRFPDRPSARIIALPASLGAEPGAGPGAGPNAGPGAGSGVDGIKWISSFPGNVASGLPRASAVLVLNDPDTGYPLAVLESSVISAARTAGSAALAADRLSQGRDRPRRLGIVGTGLIARYIHTYLVRTGWSFDAVGVHDRSAESAAGFAGYLRRSGATGSTTYADPLALIRDSDLVVFATTAASPHVTDAAAFAHGPLVLHVSLRDLAPEILLGAINIVDDVEHCLKADTSPHLAEQLVGHRRFVAGTLDDVLAGRVRPDPGRAVIFSPFGLGVLDLAVGKYVYDQARAAGELGVVDGFFSELGRHG